MTIDLTTPLDVATLDRLTVGDDVTITGTVWGLRDATLIHWYDKGNPFPADISGGVLLHTQPNVKKVDGGYVPVCVGTTTSYRMDRFNRPLLEQFGVRAILGKGGISRDSADAMRQHGCVYLTVIGGAASVETTQLEAIEEVYWEELMPECLWKFRFRNFGPLIVGVDLHGNNLHQDIADASKVRLDAIIRSGA